MLIIGQTLHDEAFTVAGVKETRILWLRHYPFFLSFKCVSIIEVISASVCSCVRGCMSFIILLEWNFLCLSEVSDKGTAQDSLRCSSVVKNIVISKN